MCLCINYGRTLVQDHSNMLFVSMYKLRSGYNLIIPTASRAGPGTYAGQYSAVPHGAPKWPSRHHTTIIRLNQCHSRPPVSFYAVQWQGDEPEEKKCFLENCSRKKLRNIFL